MKTANFNPRQSLVERIASRHRLQRGHEDRQVGRRSQWREKIDVGHEIEPERSSAEIRAEIVQKLISWAVKIAPPDPALIEGEAAELRRLGPYLLRDNLDENGGNRILKRPPVARA
jgi:hypothetical protein